MHWSQKAQAHSTVEPRPVVMATAIDYSEEQLAPFIASCQRYAPRAKIVLFGARLSDATRRWLTARDVDYQPESFPPHHAYAGWRLLLHQGRLVLAHRLACLALAGDRSAALYHDRLAEALFSVVVQRFFSYRRYLQNSGQQFSHVLLADARDVLFQSDPFPCDGLHVFSENEPIGTSHFARRWFLLSYGYRSWHPLRNQPLLNVGTTLGNTASVLSYLDAMCREFSRRRAFFWGADTAMHNAVVYRRLVAAQIHVFGDGPVLTLNAVPLALLRVVNGRVVNAQGAPFAILHQYDRVRGLELAALEDARS